MPVLQQEELDHGAATPSSSPAAARDTPCLLLLPFGCGGPGESHRFALITFTHNAVLRVLLGRSRAGVCGDCVHEKPPSFCASASHNATAAQPRRPAARGRVLRAARRRARVDGRRLPGLHGHAGAVVHAQPARAAPQLAPQQPLQQVLLRQGYVLAVEAQLRRGVRHGAAADPQARAPPARARCRRRDRRQPQRVARILSAPTSIKPTDAARFADEKQWAWASRQKRRGCYDDKHVARAARPPALRRRLLQPHHAARAAAAAERRRHHRRRRTRSRTSWRRSRRCGRGCATAASTSSRT